MLTATVMTYTDGDHGFMAQASILVGSLHLTSARCTSEHLHEAVAAALGSLAEITRQYPDPFRAISDNH